MNAATTPETLHEQLDGFLLLAGDDRFNRVIHQALPNAQKTAALVEVLRTRRTCSSSTTWRTA